jgi:stage II sporulation protein AA (anti-sigma F factor antagonist)
MTISESVAAGAFSIVRLPEEVDLGCAQQIRDTLLSTVNRGGVHLVVDARDVTFMDSSGINALIRARDRVELFGGSLHVVSERSAVRRVLELSQLDRVVHLVATMDRALSCVTDPDHIHTCDAD